MAKNGVNTKRYSLVFATAVAFCTVCAAGVSTFAWFQANASATVTTSSTSTTITVSKPDDYAFYAYNHNASSSYGTVTNNGSNTAAFEADFTTITNSNAAAKTNLQGFNPGQSMVYCLKITGATVGNAITLKIHELISNTAIKQGESYHRYAYNGSSYSIEMNIGWAIDIYTMSSTDGSGYKEFLTKNKASQSGALTDQFDYGQGTLGELNKSGTGSAPNQLISLSSDIVLYNQLATATTTYVFYRVYFSDLSTTYYTEKDSPYGDNVEVDGADRHFKHSTTYSLTGTSNCYAGLKFQLSNLILAF